MPQTIFPVTLEDAFMASPGVKHFVFKSQENPAFDYLPGQFITIHFEHGDKVIRRSYSIANDPQQNNRIELAAGYVEGGPGTELLFHLKPKETIHISGPYGRLILKEPEPARYILVATSTGITPYRSMITSLKKRLDANPKLRVVIIEGVQKREDILYKEEFLALAAYSSQVLFRAQLSREASDQLQPYEHKGYVQTAFKELALNSQEDCVYLCGNPGMIDESFAYLTEQGFTTQQIIREKYISK